MDQLHSPKEYVREQLKTLGITEITEEELESYAQDFVKLIQEHLQHDRSSSRASSVDCSPSPRRGRGAVYKSFPGEKENHEHYLSRAVPAGTSTARGGPVPNIPRPVPPPPLASPAPPNGSATPSSPDPLSISSVSTTTSRSSSCCLQKRRPAVVKRKVLRRRNGESHVFDETVSDFERGVESLGTSVSELSITSATDDASLGSENDGEVIAPSSSLLQRSKSSQSRSSPQYYKSFIRPNTSSYTMRGIRRNDPVARYHRYRREWDSFKAPGEESRNTLRWNIREQMMHQDLPLFVPHRTVSKPSNFVVPSDKKRLALRWKIRHQLAASSSK